MKPKTRCLVVLAPCLATLLLCAACERTAEDAPAELSDLQRATAGLSETIESENFVFHFEPGDGARVQVERSEAYHRWAVGYLGLTPPKKIDYYMFSSPTALRAGFGYSFGGRAYQEEFAVATAYSWHNHECFHLYTSMIGMSPRLFSEGMPVAHEFDPYNNVWVSRWNRAEPYGEPHVEIARGLKAQGLLYPLNDILESVDFNRKTGGEVVRIAYEQAGAWVTYLIDTYGIERMKRIITAIPYEATRATIKEQFQRVYGIAIEQAEVEWLAWLDQWRPTGRSPGGTEASAVRPTAAEAPR